MSNSPLVSYTKISPNKTSPRNHAIDTVTIHVYVGQASVESMGGWFSKPNAGCSCNYGIGADGRIALIVDEKDRSWCSSNAANDHRAITIEVASDSVHPYRVNSAAYKSLINLLTDICKRNNIKQLKWKADKSLIGQPDKQNMTVHRWFANKACPGEYLYSRHSKIASEVNARLGVTTKEPPKSTTTVKPESPKGDGVPYKVQVSIENLNIRKGPGTNFEKTGDCTGKGAFTITEIRSGKGSTDGWGKLKSGAGWISLDFAKKI